MSRASEQAALSANLAILTEDSTAGAGNDYLVVVDAADEPDTAKRVLVSDFLANAGLGAAPAEALIEERALESTSASETFSDLGEYRDLRLVVRGRGAGIGSFIGVGIRINGDSEANYDWQDLSGTGATPAASGSAATDAIRIGYVPGASATAGLGGVCDATIYDYLGSLNKTVVARSFAKGANTTDSFLLSQHGGEWRSTSTVTSLTALPSSGDFAAGTVISLYGRL